jgi:hypothetical protein
VVVWTRLGVRVTRGRPTRKQRRYALRDEGEGTLRLMQCVLRVSRRYALISTSRARRPQGHHPSQCSALTSCPCARECGTCVCACACTCMRVRVCEDVSPRRGRAGCRGTTPAMLCFDQLPVCVLVLRVRVCVCVCENACACECAGASTCALLHRILLRSSMFWTSSFRD